MLKQCTRLVKALIVEEFINNIDAQQFPPEMMIIIEYSDEFNGSRDKMDADIKRFTTNDHFQLNCPRKKFKSCHVYLITLNCVALRLIRNIQFRVLGQYN